MISIGLLAWVFACVLFCALSICVVLCAIRLASVSRGVLPASGAEPPILPPGSLERFSRAISIPTVSWTEDRPESLDRFADFFQFLETSYPRFFARAEKLRADEWSHLYRLPGSDPSKKPVLLLAHYDVVPVEFDEWSFDPFCGTVVDGYVRGRGTVDTKNTLIAIMEAAEGLCAVEELCAAQDVSAAEKFPSRDVYIAFGGDEEKNGIRGAMACASWLRERGIRFDWILDEGGLVGSGLLRGMNEPMGLIGVAEKGFANVVLTVRQNAGHSSRPPARQAAAVLGRAIDLKETKQYPLSLLPSVQAFFEGLAPYMRFPSNLVLSNLWLFRPLFITLMGKDPAVAAMLRTTTAFTVLEGSQAANVLPTSVRAFCNLRILPGWTVSSTLDWFRSQVSGSPDLEGLEIELDPGTLNSDPVGETATDTDSFALVADAIRTVFGVSLVLPYLNTAQSDSRHYADLSDAVYRFAPMRLSQEELQLIHGVDERISVDNFSRGIGFYRMLLKKL